MIPQNLRKGEQYYRNFRPLTRTADYPHRSIFAIARRSFNRLPAQADNPHPKAKENRRLKQSSSIVFVDMIDLRVQLINFHTFVFAVALRMIPIVKICLKKYGYHEIY